LVRGWFRFLRGLIFLERMRMAVRVGGECPLHATCVPTHPQTTAQTTAQTTTSSRVHVRPRGPAPLSLTALTPRWIFSSSHRLWHIQVWCGPCERGGHVRAGPRRHR
jgi:hypothetical protein